MQKVACKEDTILEEESLLALIYFFGTLDAWEKNLKTKQDHQRDFQIPRETEPAEGRFRSRTSRAASTLGITDVKSTFSIG